MRNFGKANITLVIYLFSFSVYSQEISFNLLNQEISISEITILEVRTSGVKDLNPTNTHYEFNGVRVHYIGISYETQINNFKVSRNQVLKYQVSSAKLGINKLPTIKILYDGKSISSPEISFQVLKTTNLKRGTRPENLFDNFFGESKQKVELVVAPEVVFHTNKTNCYIGEPIVGYFVLYYNGLRQPYLERDPNQSISFPFFLSETLQQVSVIIDPKVSRQGVERNTLVYSKEVYGLTPIQVGVHRLGSTNFVIGDSLRFGALQEALPAIDQMVTVLPLPKGAPQNFRGAIGEYEIAFSTHPTQVHLGETIYFSIRIAGVGGGGGLEDPLNSQSRAKKKQWQLLKRSKNKVFKQLPNGEYGFYSNLEFNYSFEPQKIGDIHLPKAEITYFSPGKQSYETKGSELPMFQVLPKKFLQESQVSPKNAGTWKIGNFFIWSFGVFLVFGVTGYFFSQLKKANLVKEKMKSLSGKIGSKRGEILKDFLRRKGIDEKSAFIITELSFAFSKDTWKDIYLRCGKEDRETLLNISNYLNR